MVMLLIIRHPGGEPMRTEADGTNSRIMRRHIDVRSVAYVTWHSKDEEEIGSEKSSDELVFGFFGRKGEEIPLA